ncbi:MAG: hypothetical protein GY810_00255 [Aureispira sp.]|nr:hypothetical protein [Aureispira sp.]
MKTLYDCYEEMEIELTRGDTKNPELMNLAIQLQRNDILEGIEERLEILNMKMDDVKNKLDEISFSTFNAVNQ